MRPQSNSSLTSTPNARANRSTLANVGFRSPRSTAPTYVRSNPASNANTSCDHPRITRIRYPGLPGDPGHEAASRQMRNGFGGLMAFDVGETQDEAKHFIEKLNVIYHAVSLGATETLVCIPVLTTMLYLPEERRVAFGVRPNTVRLSAGIEDTGLLLDDLKQALE